MTTIRERSIPCTDCNQWTQDLKEMGFIVSACTPDPTDPGFCKIRFQRPVERAAILAEKLAGADVGDIAAITTEMPMTEDAAGQGEEAVQSVRITGSQAKAAQAIVNLFETSEVLGNYSQVTLIAGDSGHLTYGRTQTTLGSGNLFRLIERYCRNPGARFAGRLSGFLPRLQARDSALDSDTRFHNFLRACADDRVMRETQDAFFDEVYWNPALLEAKRLGIGSPLGIAVVYDAFVHGSWARLSDRTNSQVGSPAMTGEQTWIKAYVQNRRDWLANHARADIRKTIYRMDAFERLIDQGFWGLELPLIVRDKEISIATLSAVPPGCYDGPQPGTRPLALQTPLLRGLDVRAIQIGLSENGFETKADGVFGQTSANRIKEYQARKGLPVTGVADVSLMAALIA